MTELKMKDLEMVTGGLRESRIENNALRGSDPEINFLVMGSNNTDGIFYNTYR